MYGHSFAVPTSLTTNPEPQYNYNDYHYEIKKQIKETQKLAQEHLFEAKRKSKEQYDKNLNQQNIDVGRKVLLQDKTSKNKLTTKWFGPYEVLQVDPLFKNVLINKKRKN